MDENSILTVLAKILAQPTAPFHEYSVRGAITDLLGGRAVACFDRGQDTGDVRHGPPSNRFLTATIVAVQHRQWYLSRKGERDCEEKSCELPLWRGFGQMGERGCWGGAARDGSSGRGKRSRGYSALSTCSSARHTSRGSRQAIISSPQFTPPSPPAPDR